MIEQTFFPFGGGTINPPMPNLPSAVGKSSSDTVLWLTFGCVGIAIIAYVLWARRRRLAEIEAEKIRANQQSPRATPEHQNYQDIFSWF